jgi:hypothetical protein
MIIKTVNKVNKVLLEHEIQATKVKEVENKVSLNRKKRNVLITK